ncbi:MAG: NAD-dependent epimerase/dehydratase family protein [Actinomycetes bacterium]
MRTPITQQRVFITGGAGFIGTQLVGRLVQENEVIVYDTFSRDSLSSGAYYSHPNLTIVRGDVLDPDALRAAMAGADYVVHCAGAVGVDTVIRSPIRTMRVNMIGSANVLEAAAELPDCQRVVCFSTSEVFGQQAFEATETDRTVIGAVGEARWTYAVSKLAEEHLAIAYHRERGTPTTVLRPFNVYGPGQVGEGALRTFVQRAIRNEPIEIHGEGGQIRAWCYVDDMVDATLLAMTSGNAIGESFNIGNRRSVETIYGLARTVVRLLSSSSEIRFVARSVADVELRIPQIDKARDLLGFEPRVELDEGIQRTAAYYRLAQQESAPHAEVRS